MYSPAAARALPSNPSSSPYTHTTTPSYERSTPGSGRSATSPPPPPPPGRGRRPSPNKPVYPSMKTTTPPPGTLGSSSWRQTPSSGVLYDLPIASSSRQQPGAAGAGAPSTTGEGGGELIGESPLGASTAAAAAAASHTRTGSRTRATPPPPPPPAGRRRGSPSPSSALSLQNAVAGSGTSAAAQGTMMAQREGSVYSGAGGGERQGAASTYSRRGQDGVGSPSPQDLNLFAHHCQLFYFSPNPPESSATYISKTLASLPPSHRSTYTRLQSSLRAQSHDHQTRLRLSHFHALISSTLPNVSLTPLARGDLRGNRAKKERRERVQRFIEVWCLKSGVGVEPFFKGVYNGLRLQGKGERSVGGAGGRRVVWEIDDAVFMEAGGKEFMNEAITIFKGVLGFEDVALTKPPKIRRPTIHIPRGGPTQSFSSSPLLGNDSRVEELVPLRAEGSMSPGAGRPPALPSRGGRQTPQQQQQQQEGAANTRTRSTSDPFIDPSASPDKAKANAARKPSVGKRGPAPAPPPSRSYHSPQPVHAAISSGLVSPAGDISNPLSPGVDSPLLSGQQAVDGTTVVSALEDAAERADTLTGLPSESRDRAYSDARSGSEPEDLQSLIPRRSRDLLREDVFEEDEEDEDLSAPRLRLWTFPGHISDPEIDSLLALFPKHITTSAQGVKRFPLPRPASLIALKAQDIEAGRSPSRMGEDEWPLQHGIKVPPEGCEGFVRPGTGRMWVGEGSREPGWRGGFWYRLGKWFKKLFGG